MCVLRDPVPEPLLRHTGRHGRGPHPAPYVGVPCALSGRVPEGPIGPPHKPPRSPGGELSISACPTPDSVGTRVPIVPGRRYGGVGPLRGVLWQVYTTRDQWLSETPGGQLGRVRNQWVPTSVAFGDLGWQPPSLSRSSFHVGWALGVRGVVSAVEGGGTESGWKVLGRRTIPRVLCSRSSGPEVGTGVSSPPLCPFGWDSTFP